jgi:7-keto-8-aminopelargonate synthetase-like enzyme
MFETRILQSELSSRLSSSVRGHAVQDGPDKAGEFARDMLSEGIYVIGFGYPVVPKGKAGVAPETSALATIIKGT